MNDPLRFALVREGPFWLAQGLDHDCGVQANNLNDLVARLQVAIDHVGKDLFALPPAPRYFQDLWDRKAGLLEPSMRFTMPVQLGLIA